MRSLPPWSQWPVVAWCYRVHAQRVCCEMVPDDLGESLHDSTAQPTITTEHFFDFGHTRGREEIEERERGAHADATTAQRHEHDLVTRLKRRKTYGG